MLTHERAFRSRRTLQHTYDKPSVGLASAGLSIHALPRFPNRMMWPMISGPALNSREKNLSPPRWVWWVSATEAAERWRKRRQVMSRTVPHPPPPLICS